MAGESLKVVQGNATGSSIALDAELVIGRSTPGLGSLGGDSEISRVHARVYHDASGQLMVEDLGSTNGTHVNGSRISGAQALRSGDQLRVGQTTMTVEGGAPGATTVGQIVPPPAAASPPPPAAVAATPPTQPFQPAPPPPPVGRGPVIGGGPPPGPGGPGYAGGPIGGAPGRAEGRSKAPLIALAVVVVIALVVGGLAIGGVFSSSKTVTVSAPAPAPAPPAAQSTTPATPPPAAAMPAPPATAPTTSGGYPPGVIPKLVAGCASSGKLSQSQCACWFNKLHDAYTYPQLLVVLRDAKGGSIPPKAINLLRGCLSA
jgi:hypothetical protein